MPKPAVKKLEYDADKVTSYTRTHTDDRYKGSSLEVMGPCFMAWDQDGSAGRFTVNYEEVIYVIEGQVTLTSYSKGADPEVIVALPGDVVTIPVGSDLDYSGTKGTRLFVVFSPLNWAELLVSNKS